MLIGDIIREMPKIRPIFAIFDPIIFPRINPVAPLLTAEIDVNNSGADVAVETIVKPTTTLGIPNAFAKLEQ